MCQARPCGRGPVGLNWTDAALPDSGSLQGSGSWSELSTVGEAPHRQSHTAIYDDARERMVIFGGIYNSYYNDTWTLSLSGTPTWTEMNPAGTLPSERLWHSAVFDPVRDRMIVFGGLDETSVRNDTWSLAWGSPPTGVRDPGAGTANVLLPSYPNPFNPSVVIPFKLSQDAHVTITVHDVTGRTGLEGPPIRPRHGICVSAL